MLHSLFSFFGNYFNYTLDYRKDSDIYEEFFKIDLALITLASFLYDISHPEINPICLPHNLNLGNIFLLNNEYSVFPQKTFQLVT